MKSDPHKVGSVTNHWWAGLLSCFAFPVLVLNVYSLITIFITSMPQNQHSVYCWTLERVPSDEYDPIFLPNDREVVTFGRKIEANDIICLCPNVSRRHLHFVRWIKNMFLLLFSRFYFVGV